MAYNSNGAYEPPGRGYYNQHQAAPMQDGYGWQEQQQGYDRQYYDQAHNGYQQYPRQPRKNRAPEYQDQYVDRRQEPGGYGRQQHPQERQYDPRYRQRPEQARQPSSVQQQPQHRQHRPSVEGQYDSRGRPNPGDARMYANQQQQKQSQGQSSLSQNDQWRPTPAASSRPQTASQVEKKPDPAKMSMAEWKAIEKARMHAEAMSPETLAQDNAFPVFPTYQNRSRPGTANGTHEEGGRGSTDVHSEERPVISRDKSYGSEPSQRPQEAVSRPTLEHKPVSFNAVHDHPQVKQAAAPPQQQPQLQRHDSNMAPIPVEQRVPRDQQMQAQRRPMPNARDLAMQQQQQQQQHPAPAIGYDNASYGQPNGFDGGAGRPPRQQQPRGPAVQPIDTRQLPQHQAQSYMDHGPLSPAVVPPRAASAHGSRRVAQPMTSPTSAYSQPTPLDQFGQPYSATTGGSNAIYSDNRVPPPVAAAPMSRAQEIESEMPDFDSAAPGGTSLLHKRSQVTKPAEKPPTPVAELPSPTPLPHQLGQGQAPAPAHGQRFYGQHPPTSSAPSTQVPHQPKHGGVPEGFVFEVPGDTAHQQQFDSSYMDDVAQPQYAPQQYTQHPQQPQQPYGREPPRRSMDDARQMPFRNGPPDPRGLPQPSRPPPRGAYPPQQRPPVDRNFSAQTAYTAPMPDRGNSAPPRQALHAPPGRPPMGAPLIQQRSAPDQYDPSQRHSNPDSLPHHPAPVRPGLMDNGSAMYAASKPAPVRNYSNGQSAPHQRQASIDRSSKPITPAELQKLRAYVDANPQNHKQGLVLVKKLVEAGTVLASEGGRADPRTTAKNREQYITDAYKLVKKLVSAGYPDAQFYLADCYGSGELGLEVDPREAFKLYQAAAKAGHGEAAYRTAMCCEMGAEDGGGTNKDYAKAVQWYKRAATLGNPEGMFKVGVISLKGLLGQPRNLGEAVNWLKRAIQNGQQENPHALHELGILYESTNTNPEVRNKIVADDVYALELFQKASGLGHKFSQFRLGQAYEYGQMGLQIDNRASISWYSKAAAQGEHQAELALSGWYLTGAEGILEHSDMEAYLWARKAASSEPPLAKAMFAMGYFTETGIGCPASLEEARKWYGRAASYNFPKARERLEELKRNPHTGRNSKQMANGKLSRNQKRDESECTVM